VGGLNKFAFLRQESRQGLAQYFGELMFSIWLDPEGGRQFFDRDELTPALPGAVMVDERVFRQRAKPSPQRSLLIEDLETLRELDQHHLTNFPSIIFVAACEHQQESVQ